MDYIQKNWFTEFSPDDLEVVKNGAISESTQMKIDREMVANSWPGQAFSLQVEEVLFRGKSDYQDVLVFRSKTYGNVLVLDGVIQCTERDEFAYQEMLAHLAMFSHSNPTKVLIIGGGDGGVLREVLKHECVESVSLCEIDAMVIDVSKRFLPSLSSSFNSLKLNLFIGDGLQYVKEHKNEFDVIITDSSDPVGPAESLFGEAYYKAVKESLREDGVISSQGECIWIHSNLISVMLQIVRDNFASAEFAFSSVPTYPCGSMGYLVSSVKKKDLRHPIRCIDAAEVKRMKLRYYNSEVHQAAFVLPQFVRDALGIN